MTVKLEEVGPVMIYGDWNDCHGHQFAVVWGEAGPTCTVLLFAGYDRGGGIEYASSNVPVKEVEEIVDIEEPYQRYRLMLKLLKEFPEKEK